MWNTTIAEVVKMTKQLHKELLRLDDLLLTAVNQTLRQIFKEEGTKAIYDFMEKNCCVRLGDIIAKPEDFSACLKKLLGSGAPVIERLILENFHSALGLTFEEKAGCGFSYYVNELREKRLDGQ